MKILMVTRPIAPPWDEASKNFAKDLAIELKDQQVTLLTDKQYEELPSTIEQLELYSQPTLNSKQKTKLLKLARIQSGYDVVHLLMTPTRQNSSLFKRVLRPSIASST